MLNRNLTLVIGVLGSFALVAGCSENTVGSSAAPLTASCIPDAAELEREDWLCSDPGVFHVECEDGEGDPGTIFFEPIEELLEKECDEIKLTLEDGENQAGPFPVRDEPYDVVVTAEAFDDGQDPTVVECPAKLLVEDTQDPQPVDEPKELWPPNHKFHTISGEDCVKDACDGDVQVTFHWATSDEPVNDKGDGNTEPDIILECDRVQLRAERQGPSNGRVYRLGWTAVDDAGNETEEQVFVVTVPHDQSGREAIDDGEENGHRVEHEDGECDDRTGGTGGDDGDDGAGGDEGGGDDGAGGEGGGPIVVL